MVYILGKNLKKKENIVIGLQTIFGIGKAFSEYLCQRLGMTSKAKISNLTREKVRILTKIIMIESTVDIDLKRNIKDNILRKINSGSLSGKKYVMGLPVNGQRTKNNRKTAKKLNNIKTF